MYVKSNNDCIRYVKTVDGYLVRVETDEDECGSDSIIWGFLAGVAGLFFLVVFLCFGVPAAGIIIGALVN